ncbi:MAG: hypothetical protein MK085_09550 [Phycisphaerales bacterium]|nr:hypothetical protein [Phycisphaerales bacterium]
MSTGETSLGLNAPVSRDNAARVAEPVLLPGAAGTRFAEMADDEPTSKASTASTLESTPLPVSGQTLAGTANATAAGTSWWASPEMKVIGMLALLAVAAMLFIRFSGKGVLRGVRLAGGSQPSGVVQILSRFPIGRGQQVLLLECGPRVILVHQQGGRSGGGLTTLTEFVERDEIAELRRRLEAGSRGSDQSFQKDLEQSLGLYGRDGNPVGVGSAALPISDSIETVDLTRRRPRRWLRGNG